MPELGVRTGTYVLGRKIDSMIAELDGRQAWSKLLAAAKYADEYGIPPVLNADTGGDGLMSNWWREGSGRRGNRRPIPIVTVVRSVGQFQVSVEPAARSRGPWRVLEEGRKANTAGVTYTPGYIKKGRDGRSRVPKNLNLGDGMRLYRRRTRGASRSRPKYTWTKATVAMTPLAAYMGRTKIEEAFLRVWQRSQGATTIIGPASANVLRSGINSPGKDLVNRTRQSIGTPRYGGYSTWKKPVPWSVRRR